MKINQVKEVALVVTYSVREILVSPKKKLQSNLKLVYGQRTKPTRNWYKETLEALEKRKTNNLKANT